MTGKRLLFNAFLVFLFSISPIYGEGRVTSKDLFSRGIQQYKEGNFKESLDLFINAATETKQKKIASLAFFNAAGAAHQAGQNSQQIEGLLQRALELDPGNKKAAHNLELLRKENNKQKDQQKNQNQESSGQKDQQGNQKQESSEQKDQQGSQKQESSEQKDQQGSQKQESSEQKDQQANKNPQQEQKEKSMAAQAIDKEAESILEKEQQNKEERRARIFRPSKREPVDKDW